MDIETIASIVVLSAACRADGMIDYAKDGPGAFTSVLPPVFEKLEGQLEANNASRLEIERFIEELNRTGSASVSFTDRRHAFHA